jgi:hypothetical protein
MPKDTKAANIDLPGTIQRSSKTVSRTEQD